MKNRLSKIGRKNQVINNLIKVKESLKEDISVLNESVDQIRDIAKSYQRMADSRAIKCGLLENEIEVLKNEIKLLQECNENLLEYKAKYFSLVKNLSIK